MGSLEAAQAAQEAFTTILEVSFNTFDTHVPHEWARWARYTKGDIEAQLSAYLNEAFVEDTRLPEEVSSPDKFVEGAVCRVVINAYERNPTARAKCIAYYGLSCVVCGFNFEAVYGEVGKGFIHVHHLRPLAEIGETYEVDPIADLRPVCANCHAIIHRRDPSYNISEVQKFLNRRD